jgi:hypothetical protein
MPGLPLFFFTRPVLRRRLILHQWPIFPLRLPLAPEFGEIVTTFMRGRATYEE